MKKFLGTVIVTAVAGAVVWEIGEEILDHIWVRKKRKEVEKSSNDEVETK